MYIFFYFTSVKVYIFIQIGCENNFATFLERAVHIVFVKNLFLHTRFLRNFGSTAYCNTISINI
jgi:hypothetical protein